MRPIQSLEIPHMESECRVCYAGAFLWGAVRKILYLTDLAQKLLSPRIFSYLCTEIGWCRRWFVQTMGYSKLVVVVSVLVPFFA